MRKRALPRSLVAIGAVLVVVAVLWALIAPSLLVKYPKSLDITPHYAGQFTLYVNPQTGAALPSPQVIPLQVDRKLHAHNATSSKVVVDEKITQTAGTLVLTQNNAYVMDRKSMKNVKDDRAYAFDPSNVVDRSNTYRLNLPMDTKRSGSYSITKNELTAPYTLKSDTADPSGKEAGLKVDNFVASVKDAPASPKYLAWLHSAVPLPSTVTLQQLKPQLKAAGVDLDAILTSLSTVLQPAEMAQLSQAATTPLQIDYLYSFDGRAAVEPRTGAEVFVKSTESLSAKPQMTPLVGLQTLLAKYQSAPAVQAATQALTAVATGPASPLFKADFQQTPASVTEVAKKIKSQRNQIAWVRYWIPALFLAVGLIVVAVGLVLWFRRPAPEAGTESAATRPRATTRQAMTH